MDASYTVKQATNYGISSSVYPPESGTTWVDSTVLTVTITTGGNPVWVGLIPEGGNTLSEDGSSTHAGYVSTANGAPANGFSPALRIKRGSNVVGLFPVSGITAPGLYQVVDPVAAGTYTYTISWFYSQGKAIRLAAFELG